ncbi:hypothetical protein AVEN_180179-1 [Araneus ventricosus]|uniref:Uncharacterized protein n=1 Tax=Araneus ventricosus TaxID=182803 RepID=A0A4Y2B7V9_ARAVE|nr:hypothetical protein AVEN_180179-1 [Araneus ventricosus]
MSCDELVDFCIDELRNEGFTFHNDLFSGCDSGMGHRMARKFDEMHMHVFAGCLQPAGKGALELKRICSDRLHIVPIDITNDEQVREAVAYVEANLPAGEKGMNSYL